MKTDKDVLMHAILLKAMGRLNVARVNTDRDNSQRRAKEKSVVKTLRTATDASIQCHRKVGRATHRKRRSEMRE